MTTPGREFATYQDCPDRRKHTSEGPEGLAWHGWVKERAKTHLVGPCPTCGFYVMQEAKP